MNDAWRKELAAGAPVPETFYSSPLQRSAKTLEITWSDLVLKPKRVKPIIVEGFRLVNFCLLNLPSDARAQDAVQGDDWTPYM